MGFHDLLYCNLALTLCIILNYCIQGVVRVETNDLNPQHRLFVVLLDGRLLFFRRQKYLNPVLVIPTATMRVVLPEEDPIKSVSAETNKIDVLINNAAIKIDDKELQDVSAEIVQNTMNVNLTGPLLMAKHFVEFLKKSDHARLVNISGRLASLLLLEDQKWGSYSYNGSKAAMNIATRMMAHELKPDGICVVAVHPGWMQTDMGGVSADLEPSVSAERVLGLIANLTLADTNKFLVYNGEDHPW